jgi:hypothetical protein
LTVTSTVPVTTIVEVVKYVTTAVWPPQYFVVVAGQTVVVVYTVLVVFGHAMAVVAKAKRVNAAFIL